jgi:hypothetical protein
VTELELKQFQYGEGALRSSVSGDGLQSTFKQSLILAPFRLWSQLSTRKLPGLSNSSPELIAGSGYHPIAPSPYFRAAMSLCVSGMIIALVVLLNAFKTSNSFQSATQFSQDACSYAPTVILILVGYGIQSPESSVPTLEKYWTLVSNKKPGRQVVLPTRISVNARFSALKGLPFAMFTALTVSSIVYLALKIVAAGLYKPLVSPQTSHVVLDTEVGPILWFDVFSGRIGPAWAKDWASGPASPLSGELKLQFNNPKPQKVIGDLVTPLLLEKLTRFLGNETPREFYASKITMESFAMQINVTCAGFSQAEFELTVKCHSSGTYCLPTSRISLALFHKCCPFASVTDAGL